MTISLPLQLIFFRKQMTCHPQQCSVVQKTRAHMPSFHLKSCCLIWFKLLFSSSSEPVLLCEDSISCQVWPLSFIKVPLKWGQISAAAAPPHRYWHISSHKAESHSSYCFWDYRCCQVCSSLLDIECIMEHNWGCWHNFSLTGLPFCKTRV